MSQIEQQESKVTLPEPTSDDDISDEDEPTATAGADAGGANRHEKLERLKREKRLAMNRECARARRRRKKLRMELLDNRVHELTQKNNRIQDDNMALRARVMQLEAELGAAKSNMGLDASSLMGGAGGMGIGGFDVMSSQALIAEKLNLQRRAALAGFGGPSAGAPTSGLGGFMGSAGGSSDQATALRYMQLMQAKSVAGGGDQGKSLLGGPPFSAASIALQGASDAPADFMY